MSDLYPSQIPHMATSDVIHKLCFYLEISRDSTLQYTVVKCISSMLTSSDKTVIDNVLSEGILASYSRLLKPLPNQTTTLVLFSLSNIAAGTSDQVKALRNDYELL